MACKTQIEPYLFRKKLQSLINEVSKENGSDTPDFILAEYLNDCLVAFDRAVVARERWYGRLTSPCPFYEIPEETCNKDFVLVETDPDEVEYIRQLKLKEQQLDVTSKK